MKNTMTCMRSILWVSLLLTNNSHGNLVFAFVSRRGTGLSRRNFIYPTTRQRKLIPRYVAYTQHGYVLERSPTNRGSLPILHASLSPTPPPSTLTKFKKKVDAHPSDTTRQRIIVLVPLISAVASYFLYEDTSKALHAFIEAASQHNWEAADGGKLASNFLSYGINGPIIACVSILFGTLVSTTISNLHERQDIIRSCIVHEVEEVRFLFQLLEGLPSGKTKAKQHLEQYAQDLLGGVFLGDMNDQYTITKRSVSLKSVVAELNRLIVRQQQDNDNTNAVVPDTILSGALDCITRINSHRAERIAAMNSTFPPSHYLLLTLLASAICMAFLMETDVEALWFVADTQLRLLWGTLVGTLASLAVVCYDLSYPFSGFYKITKSSDQQVLSYLNYALNNPTDEEMEI